MYILPQNRHTPCYINIAITRYNELLGHQHKQAQKKKKRKKEKKTMPRPTDRQK
jgi:hypothetical protein